ncbi:Thioredoxin domain-containing protein 11 [Triplophysa tibetana]|uniref:Thioredoxin domain-containing protein 11 n=1 Tax=Triplophysa tibetana TaxID=1572043 RepID=A0A5A9PIC8_9TELE|nr:Thioredoxin domain-containing protein 11 [Triplophysa tibetana]
MARRPELCCGAIALTCALILPITFTCGPVKNVVAAARSPVRFFPEEVPVVDLFLGQLDEADRLREEADVSVMFYYAPWCAHSVTARRHVQHVALRLAQQVQFIAVNCWWHYGKCRKQKRFFQYPIIHVYYRSFGPIEYRAPVHSEYLESFVQRVSRPLTYLPTQKALHTFLNHKQQGVVGYFEFNSSPQPAGYLVFLISALMALKRDHQGAVRFAVVTNQAVAEGVSLTEDESVYLHRRLNSSLVFPRAHRNLTAEAVCDWVYENRESVVHWIHPTGAKSYLLEAELLKGPALLTFLPHNPLQTNHLLTQVSEVALRYHSGCGSEGGVSGIWRCCRSLRVRANVCELCSRPSGCVVVVLHRLVWLLYGSESRFSSSGSSVPRKQRRHCGQSGVCVCHSKYSQSGVCVFTCVCVTQNTVSQVCVCVSLKIQSVRCVSLKIQSGVCVCVFVCVQVCVCVCVSLKIQSVRCVCVSLKIQCVFVCHSKYSQSAVCVSVCVCHSKYSRVCVCHSKYSQSGVCVFVTQNTVSQVCVSLKIQSVMCVCVCVCHSKYSQVCVWCSGVCNTVRCVCVCVTQNTVRCVCVSLKIQSGVCVCVADMNPVFHKHNLSHRKQMSVKFPENTPVTLPNLLRFILQHTSHAPWAGSGGGAGSKSLLEAELRVLQQEVSSLQRARERLSHQLAVLWRENRHLTLQTHALESQNAELQAQSGHLETLYSEKTRQLSDTVQRLQDLAYASEELLKENSLLKVLLNTLRETDRDAQTDR